MNKLVYHSNNITTKQVNENNMSYIVFHHLEALGIVRHCFTSRLGGASEGHFSSLNLSFNRGDSADNVLENYKRICKAIKVDYRHAVLSDQIHKTVIGQITLEDMGKGIVRESDMIGIDGLITNVPGIPLVTLYADCVPLYFVDTEHRAIGLAHSGWKGTVGRMGAAVVEAMKNAFQTKPEKVVAAIGPSICKDCYEVSQDVISEFQSVFLPSQWTEIFEQKENGKYQLDLWKANEFILYEAGVLPENTRVTDICTCCNPDYFFSHRASQGKRGNLAAILELT